MEMLKCEKCGKEFKNDLALRIHVGKQHGKQGKAKTARKKARRSAKGAFVCETCGRRFRLAAHLGRHAAAAHGKAKKARKVGKSGGQPVVPRGAPAGPDVRSLSVDQLLALKKQVDDRLRDIVRRMRAARIRV